MQFRVQCAVGENLYINCDLIIVGHDNNIDNDAVLVDDAEERDLAQVVNVADYEEETNLISDYDDYEEYPTVTDYDYSNEVDEDVEGSGGSGEGEGDYVEGGGGGGVGGGVGGVGGGVGGECPGGDLQTCVDVCPGQFGARVFGLCVATCGRRCP